MRFDQSLVVLVEFGLLSHALGDAVEVGEEIEERLCSGGLRVCLFRLPTLQEIVNQHLRMDRPRGFLECRAAVRGRRGRSSPADQRWVGDRAIGGRAGGGSRSVLRGYFTGRGLAVFVWPEHGLMLGGGEGMFFRFGLVVRDRFDGLASATLRERIGHS